MSLHLISCLTTLHSQDCIQNTDYFGLRNGGDDRSDHLPIMSKSLISWDRPHFFIKILLYPQYRPFDRSLYDEYGKNSHKMLSISISSYPKQEPNRTYIQNRLKPPNIRVYYVRPTKEGFITIFPYIQLWAPSNEITMVGTKNTKGIDQEETSRGESRGVAMKGVV